MRRFAETRAGWKRHLFANISPDGTVSDAYHCGFATFHKHLEELGAPEPKLRPFDESKFQPLPNMELNPKDEFWVDPESLDGTS